MHGFKKSYVAADRAFTYISSMKNLDEINKSHRHVLKIFDLLRILYSNDLRKTFFQNNPEETS